MRPLKFAPQHKLTTATIAEYEADQAQALPLLRSLAATRPLGVSEEKHFRLLISVATQYRGQGVSWAELLTAGYEALEENLAQHDGQSEKVADHLAWWVREKILNNLQKKYNIN